MESRSDDGGVEVQNSKLKAQNKLQSESPNPGGSTTKEGGPWNFL
jgi:hypothetical protein